jgi:hypothetical protein
VTADLEQDLLHVRYDPQRVTPETMLRVITERDFQGEIVSRNDGATAR